MLITDLNGNEFQLNIIDYQFPDLPASSNRWDLNWLRIHILIKTPLGHIEFSDPALLTWEVQRLTDWLILVAFNKSIQNDIRFIEGIIWFSHTSKDIKVGVLHVNFNLGKNRSWIPTNDTIAGTERINEIDFVLSPDELIKASHDLAMELKQHPLRG